MPGTTRQHPPLVVIANSQELHTRTLESILGPHGYAVLRAYTGKQALERCRSARPDVIIVDVDLPDIDGLEVCRTLRNDPVVSQNTPILVTSSGHSSRKERLEALRAGAWDFLGAALDDDELPLRLDAYVRAKFEADRVREESLFDQLTGLYNARGLTRRARELGAHAFRMHSPFACVVFSTIARTGEDADAAETQITATIEKLAKALRERGRNSDAIGRLGPNEFVVIAQDTDAEGAVRMAERLTDELRVSQPDVRVVAGFDAVPNYHEAPIDTSEMLARASRAMRQSRAKADGQWISRFETAGIN
jgi:diguanylate cyclase (GGDEF)-like protein